MSIEAGALLAVGLCAFGFMGAAIGLGAIFSKMIETVGRQPNSEPRITKFMWIGLAFVEQFGLFALIIAFIVLFTKT